MATDPHHRTYQSWAPLVSGSARDQVLGIVQAVADELAAPGYLDRPEHYRSGGPDLGDGAPGVAVALSYFDRAIPGRGYDEAAERCLGVGLAAISEEVESPALYSGVSGVGWAVEHIFKGELDEDANQEVDRCVLDHLADDRSFDDYDLISGLVGLGVYALERGSRPTARPIIDKVVGRLGKLSMPLGPGARTWHLPPQLLSEEARQHFPKGRYDLGIAHGVPGIIAFLAAVLLSEESPPETRQLLDEASVWLLRNGKARDGSFGYALDMDGEVSLANPAWCYGDPGVAAALLLVAQATDDDGLRRLAIDVLLRAARCTPEQARAYDASLCHGTMSFMHVLNRAYQLTGEPALGVAAIRWLDYSLALRRRGDDIAGFGTFVRATDSYRSMPGLLMGTAGTALSLLAMATDLEPASDRMLLLSAAETRWR